MNIRGFTAIQYSRLHSALLSARCIREGNQILQIKPFTSVNTIRGHTSTIAAQRVNDMEQSPTEFLHATEEGARDREEKVRDVVAHRACRVPPLGSGRRHLLSIANRVIISLPLVGHALDLLWYPSARRATKAA
jgi:hypothetical protein